MVSFQDAIGMITWGMIIQVQLEIQNATDVVWQIIST